MSRLHRIVPTVAAALATAALLAPVAQARPTVSGAASGGGNMSAVERVVHDHAARESRERPGHRPEPRRGRHPQPHPADPHRLERRHQVGRRLHGRHRQRARHRDVRRGHRLQPARDSRQLGTQAPCDVGPVTQTGPFARRGKDSQRRAVVWTYPPAYWRRATCSEFTASLPQSPSRLRRPPCSRPRTGQARRVRRSQRRRADRRRPPRPRHAARESGHHPDDGSEHDDRRRQAGSSRAAGRARTGTRSSQAPRAARSSSPCAPAASASCAAARSLPDTSVHPNAEGPGSDETRALRTYRSRSW